MARFERQSVINSVVQRGLRKKIGLLPGKLAFETITLSHIFQKF